MQDELIKYIMERADKHYTDDFPITLIPDWINGFFDKYQPERSKREDSRYVYVLWQISPTGNMCREGEVDTKEEADEWVKNGVSAGFTRCWHEQSRDAVL
jgi:hypothetical protein